jgi:hypothetical protein
MDLAFDDMYGYWLVLGLNRGSGQFLNFLAAQTIFQLKKCISRGYCEFAMAMLSACTSSGLLNCFILVSRVWWISSGIGLCFHWLEDCANLHKRWRKTYNTAPTTLGPIQAERQSTFVNTQLYSISRNDRNKQLIITKPT